MGKHKVFIMRGIPGCGKSTYIEKKARQIDETLPLDVEVCSADHHFMLCPHEDDFGKDPNSQRNFAYHSKVCTAERVYKFKPNELGKAHIACQDKFLKVISGDTPTLIFVDNTNTTRRELNYYVGMCMNYDCEFVIVNVHCDPDKAAARCSHDVPREKVRQLHARMVNSDKDIPVDWPQEHIYNS